MATGEELLALARRELGTREQPSGSNRVKYNTEYYGREVSGSGFPLLYSGDNGIAFSGDITEVHITPRWCCL